MVHLVTPLKNKGIYMAYLICYLYLGLILVIIESPIRKLVDEAVTDTIIQEAITNNKIPYIRIFLLRLILSAVLILIYPIMFFC